MVSALMSAPFAMRYSAILLLVLHAIRRGVLLTLCVNETPFSDFEFTFALFSIRSLTVLKLFSSQARCSGVTIRTIQVNTKLIFVFFVYVCSIVDKKSSHIKLSAITCSVKSCFINNEMIYNIHFEHRYRLSVK